MILQKLDYKEIGELVSYWALKDLTLGKINLLVGKNATGKTNTIDKILCLGNMIVGVKPQLYYSGNFYAEFADADDIYEYWLEISNWAIVFEKLVINGEEKFIRNDNGTGEIYAEELKRKIKVQLPPNQLLVVSRRDAIQHPYLEKIYAWADGLRVYEFGSSLGKNDCLRVPDENNKILNLRYTNSTIEFFNKGAREFNDEFKESVKESMKKIGYELNEVEIFAVNESPVTGEIIYALYVREESNNVSISQMRMSQGMFRALSLIIQITYIELKKLSTTILIDDIGEGLDFDRSTRLIKLLIEIAEKNENISLIMSTNDRFVMNAVPLKYWQVIQRKDSECRVFNYRNSREKFDEFEYTGLNNFDFLRTDFLNSNWEPV